MPVQQLIDKVELIALKYQQIDQTDNFNLFTVLRDITDEVNLHSKFIFEILNPKGSHNQGEIFLSLFLETAGIENFSIKDVMIRKEANKIDILITNNSGQAIIIENKIGARDRLKQLYNYYNFLIRKGFKKENIFIIYLTPDGKEPSEDSLGDLLFDEHLTKFLVNISYQNHVDLWLKKCIKEIALFPTLRESLVLYKKTVNDMTGNSMKDAEKIEIIKLVSENNNAAQVFKLVSNWDHVRWHTEWDFWNELESLISKKYIISSLRKYSSDYLTGAIHKSRNRDQWYGIMFCIKKADDIETCVFIERGDERLYYGIIMVKNNTTLPSKDFPEIISRLDDIVDWKATSGWIGGRFSKTNIDFESFSTQDTFDLANPEKRKHIINSLWKDIQEFIDVVANKLT